MKNGKKNKTGRYTGEKGRMKMYVSGFVLTSILIFTLLTSAGEERDDIAVELTNSTSLVAGKEALLTFRVENNRTGEPVAGLEPELDFYTPGGHDPTSKHIHFGGHHFTNKLNLAKVQVFLLNSGHARIEVMDTFGSYDPRPSSMKSMTSSSKVIMLKGSPRNNASDMIASRYGNYLYVTLPEDDRVAVVNTITHEVMKYIDVGTVPDRLYLQPGSKYLWVTGNASVSVIDTDSNILTRTINTGKGHHEIAFSAVHAYVTNSQENTVTVIRLNDLTRTGYVKVPERPYGIDYSEASDEIYVTNTVPGVLTVIDGNTAVFKKFIRLTPGIETVKFSPDGERGVVLNRYADRAHIIDTGTGSLMKTVKTGKAPVSVAFIEEFAIIRNTYSNDVTYVSMISPEVSNNEIVGNNPPFTGGHHSIMTTSSGYEAAITSPRDGRLYMMHKMRGRPMVMSAEFAEYGTDAVAIVIDRLHETEPGTYRQYIKLDREGSYAVEFTSREINATFEIEVIPDETTLPGTINTPLFTNRTFTPGNPSVLRYLITDRKTGDPEESITDLSFRIVKPVTGKGTWTKLVPSRHAGNGIYEVSVTFPEEGKYMVIPLSSTLDMEGYRPVYAIAGNTTSPFFRVNNSK